MKLNAISDNHGAKQSPKRVGRGIGSGLGKTCGAGHKGQLARTGVAVKSFEGGQMPLHRRLPKRGFTSRNKFRPVIINIKDLQRCIDAGLDAKRTITVEDLLKVGLISGVDRPIKVLANGVLKQPTTITLSQASAGAIKAFKASGGDVILSSVE